MKDLLRLIDARMTRFAYLIQRSPYKPRIRGRCAISGIIFTNRNGLRWRNAPAEHGSDETLYNRWKRWSDKGIFARMVAGLAAGHGEEKIVMIDAIYLKVHRTATAMDLKKGGRGRLIGRIKGGMNTKLHAICDTEGLSVYLFVNAG